MGKTKVVPLVASKVVRWAKRLVGKKVDVKVERSDGMMADALGEMRVAQRVQTWVVGLAAVWVGSWDVM